jgi:hypothetical protein
LNVRLGVIGGVIVSVTAAVSSSRVSDTPLLAFAETAVVGLACTLLAVGLIALGRRS